MFFHIVFIIYFVFWLLQIRTMKRNEVIDRIYLYFSSWSKKGYAIFASLGQEVRISRLALHMYVTVMLKSSIKGLLVNMDQVTKMIVSFMELKVNKWIRWRVEGEVCPDTNPIFII